MKAKITTVPISVLYSAWCEECAEGFSSKSKKLVNNWAAIHEELRHIEPFTRRNA